MMSDPPQDSPSPEKPSIPSIAPRPRPAAPPAMEGSPTDPVPWEPMNRRDGPPTQPPEPPGKGAKTDITWVFLLLAAILVIIPLLNRQKPDHCPNDASRWNAVFFLSEFGDYKYRTEAEWKFDWNGGKGLEADELVPGLEEVSIKIGDLYYPVVHPNPDYTHCFWGIAPFWSVDMIKVGENYYSSKPPLLPTCMAGVVWVEKKVSSLIAPEAPWTWATHHWELMRTSVIVVQVLPFLFAVWLIARDVRRQSDSPFVRNFCVAAAAFATYLTPYLLTFNNHVAAACTATIALYAVIRIWYGEQRQWYWFLIANFFAVFTAGLETPAAIFAVLVFLMTLGKSTKKALIVGLPAALIPAAAAAYTTYLVTGSVVPIPMRFNEEGGPYYYDGSYWHNTNEAWAGLEPGGMDALEEEKEIYLAHLLIGHHGFFLLTPIFLLSLLGIFAHWSRRDEGARPLLAWMVLLLTAGIVALYTLRTNNYGGGCQGPRWLFWLIPLWLVMLPAGVEVLARARIGRCVCYLLMGVSLLSVVWAMPHVDDNQRVDTPPHKGVVRPWSNSWAHQVFRKDWIPKPLRIDY